MVESSLQMALSQNFLEVVLRTAVSIPSLDIDNSYPVLNAERLKQTVGHPSFSLYA
jgi:hypothetical protein